MGWSRTDVSDIETKDGEFRCKITKCQLVNRRKNVNDPEKMLRFDLVWVLDYKGLRLGERHCGCIAYRYYDKKRDKVVVLWSPPRTKVGFYYKQNTLVSLDLYEIVLKAIEASGYTQYIGASDMQIQDIKDRDPHKVDENLPLEINVAATVEELLK